MSNLFKVSLFKDSFLNSKLVESRNVFASSDDDAREMKFQSNLLESIKKDLNTFDERDLKIKNLLDKR